eukprot:TRINITY_DN111706_c0_g1_i1.p1 TRINITY_DN111706_c0_g1~~TRINITY_DN111706_c0_g1_i1.p1  ORF type:complete len:310 (+),score=52.61 TRINITY_DN111706_c0_g1_i1:205-1134(+)
MSSSVDGLLSQMLRGIFQGCPDLCEARRQAHTLHREVWMMERKGVAHKEQENAVDGLEIVLASILKVSGKSCKAEEAKHWLRTSFGDAGRAVASQISSLSKARNAKSHPKAYKIVAAIERLVTPPSAENSVHGGDAGGDDGDPAVGQRGGFGAHSRLPAAAIRCDHMQEDIEVKLQHLQAEVQRMTQEHDDARTHFARDLEEKSAAYERQIQELMRQPMVPVESPPCAHSETQVNESLIRLATVYSMPDGGLRKRFDDRVQAHQSKYPGGTLPCELRSFEKFKEDFVRMASSEQRAAMLKSCRFCGAVL